MKKHKIIGLIFGMVFAASAMAATKHFDIKDHYHEVVYLEPYTIEVCEQQRVTNQDDLINNAFWGAIFGAVVGDVIDEDNGKVPGAVIGAAIGANEAEKNSTTTAMVCKTETRKKSTTVNEYSHSTITFEYDGIMYEVDFIKKQ